MVYKGCDRTYARMVTAEHKINVRSNGKVVQKWTPKSQHIDNHYLDCEVYAMAAADILGVRELYMQEEQEHRQQERAQEPEEQWIQEMEEWI